MSERETYYRIGSSIWREFTDDDQRTAAFYILTCDHRTTEGLFFLPLGYAAEDIGWTRKRVDRTFAQVFDHGLARYDHDARVCLIPKALEWQAPANPNQMKAAVKRLVSLPETALFPSFYGLAQRFAEPFAERLAERFPERIIEHSISSSFSSSVCVSGATEGSDTHTPNLREVA